MSIHIFGSCKLMCLSFVYHIFRKLQIDVFLICLSHFFGSCKLMCLSFVYHIFGSCKLMCFTHILEVANLTINFMCLSFVSHLSFTFLEAANWCVFHLSLTHSDILEVGNFDTCKKMKKRKTNKKKEKKWDKTNKTCKKVIKSDKKCFFEIFNVLIWFKVFYWDYLCPMPSWTPSEVNPSCSRRAKVLVIICPAPTLGMKSEPKNSKKYHA